MLARIIHESPAATTDTAVLPGVLGHHPLLSFSPKGIMPSQWSPVTHVSGTPVTYVPSLYTLPPGEGNLNVVVRLIRFSDELFELENLHRG